MTKTSILIVGAGAVGRSLAARLIAAGCSVTFATKNKEVAQAWRSHGLTFRASAESNPQSLPVDAISLGSDSPRKFSLIFSCVKAYDSAEALSGVRDCVASEATVITCSNGLGNLEAVESVFPAASAMVATITGGARRDGKHGVVVTGDGRVTLAARPSVDSQRCTLVVELLHQAGLLVEQEDDVEWVIWAKVAINCAINPLATLLRCPNGVFAEQPRLLAEGALVAEEVASVAKANGVLIPNVDWQKRVLRVSTQTAVNHCSMLEDFHQGRRSEIDQLSGEVVERGLSAGVPTPRNALLHSMVSALWSSVTR